MFLSIVNGGIRFGGWGGGANDHTYTFSYTTDIVHVVYTWDGTTRRGYVNGSEAFNDTPTLSIGSAIARIAQHPTDGGKYFSGTLDEVAIYDSILSPTRVAAHYNAGI